jgi:2-methylisocitrate lyase-like PEP mutase family enzyme
MSRVRTGGRSSPIPLLPGDALYDTHAGAAVRAIEAAIRTPGEETMTKTADFRRLHQSGIPRTDVYLRGLAPEGQRAAECIRRAGLYEEAGADGIFPAGMTDMGISPPW